MAVYSHRLFVLPGLRFCGGHTVANIPYDALAMELSDSFTARSQIMGIKGLFGLAGLLSATVLSIGERERLDCRVATCLPLTAAHRRFPSRPHAVNRSPAPTLSRSP